MNFELIYLLVFYRYRPSQLDRWMVTWLSSPWWLILSTQGPAVSRPRSREKTKRGVIADSPFVHYSRMLNLELISVVYISVCPVAATPGAAVLINPEVLLHGSGQVRSIIPHYTTTDAHPRRNEVPQIPLSD